MALLQEAVLRMRFQQTCLLGVTRIWLHPSLRAAILILLSVYITLLNYLAGLERCRPFLA